MRRAPDENAPVCSQAEQDVLLEVIETADNWAHVKHQRRRHGLHPDHPGLGAMKLAVLGAGAWGTALGRHAQRGGTR